MFSTTSRKAVKLDADRADGLQARVGELRAIGDGNPIVQGIAATQELYRQRNDGQLDVFNRCLPVNGDMTEAVGRAPQIGAADSSRLEVRFAPACLSWLPGSGRLLGHRPRPGLPARRRLRTEPRIPVGAVAPPT